MTSSDVKLQDTPFSVWDGSITQKPPPLRLDVIKEKAVISGNLESPEKRSFALLFELAPVWLFSLEPLFVENIYFPQFQSEADLIASIPSTHSSWLCQALQQFDQDVLHYSVNSKAKITQPIITLVSGSFHFFEDCRANDQIVSSFYLFIVHQHFRCRYLPHPSFHRIKHNDHGGPTSFETVWTSSVSALEVFPSPLRRNIYSFIDYGVRPKTVVPELSEYMLGSKFPLQHMYSPVQFQSSFYSYGYGSRNLTSSELAHMFGIPTRWHDACASVIFPILPVQILDVLLKSFLQHVHAKFTTPTPLYKPIPTPIIVPDNTPVFLRSLNRSLPSLWSRSSIPSQMATKADDALVDMGKWDLRITSLWSNAASSLSILRSFLLRVAKRRLFREFKQYLLHAHFEAFQAYVTSREQTYTHRFFKQQGGKDLMGLNGNNVTRSKVLSGVSQKFSVSVSPQKTKQFLSELSSGRQVLHSYMSSSFFGWDGGSTLIFWRWHATLQTIAREGFPIQIQKELPTTYQKMIKPKSPMYEQLLSKIQKGIARDYLVPTPQYKVKNLIQYFGVPKGPTDIRMVQNGTSCLLNESVWASNFCLPTPKSMTRILGFNYKAVDIDLGEMFLNFPLDRKLISFSGMDVTPFRAELEGSFKHISNNQKKLYLTCTRCWMGFRPSPELACRFYYLAEEFVRGDRKCQNNPLRWDKIVLNLMGNENFNPALPNVFKWNEHVKRISGDLKAYVDDLRAIGWSLEHAWAIAHRVASRLQFLGIQDAPRKRRIDNGPWAGAIYQTTKNLIQKTVSQEKWDKAKGYIDNLNTIFATNKNALVDYKLLERVRGFLCHLAMTFDLLFPFLKGFHLTLCAHLPQRNEEGWKIKELEWLGLLEQMREEGKMSDQEVQDSLDFKYDPKIHPSKLKVVPRFHTCLKALTIFFNSKSPPLVTERSSEVHLLVYGFADASKSGFGASLQYEGNLRYRIGTWGSDEDDVSSNFREFSNVVETLEEEYEAGRLSAGMVILATDNSTVECALYKGNSSNEKLFDLVVRLKNLELKSSTKFIITHVSGERMKSQGTDGISRGQLREGVSLGQAMLSFCPWGLSALERSPELLPWIKKVVGKNVIPLSPEGWYTRAHDIKGGSVDQYGFWRHNIQPGTYLWTPPPAAADAALEQLRIARLKRRKSSHIIAIPRLATSQWLKQLNKAADIVLTLPPKYSFWKTHMFEPLLLAFLFPYLPFRPWQLRATPKLLASAREMQKMFRQEDLDPGDILYKFFRNSKRLPSLPLHVVSKVLYFGQGG